MRTLRVILGDQLTRSLPIVEQAEKDKDVFLLAEVKSEATYVKHHKKKIAFIFSAMRHFARELESSGHKVMYVKYTDRQNQGCLTQQVKHAISEINIDQVCVTECGEYRLQQELNTWQAKLQVPVNILPDTRFLASPSDFSDWANGKKQLRMEFFYREMRKRHNILMQDGQPVGGQWNYDQQNREPMPETLSPPKPSVFEPDEIALEVLEMVETVFSDHFGELTPFQLAVTRTQALQVLDVFIAQRLEQFGRFQDAMLEGQPWMYHSHIAFYLNCGLLTPSEVIHAGETAYYEGNAPLNSVEGFIRQILGWREYVRGFYWYFMPNLQSSNFFNHTENLPEFFWTGQTNMNCLRQCVKETKQNAYAHHIQRLMVLGNFCLLAGIEPKQVQEWYLLVYADAYEWVELPNVAGMVLYADGGKLASKPYISSGSYINKMSNYCKNCGYQISKKHGERACPFNYLYWHFIHEHREALSSNPRMAMMYRTFDKMKPDSIDAMNQSAIIFKQKLANNEEV